MNKFDQWPSLRIYEQLGVPYVLHSDDWGGPLWTGHCMMLSVKDSYGDAGFFHELAHWLATPEEDRPYPDFRLGRWVNAAGDSYTFASSTVKTWVSPEHKAFRPHDRNQGWGENTVKLGDASENEFLACAALALYEPLCNIWSWKAPIRIEKINSALYDFNGGGIQDYIGDYPIDVLHEKIVLPIASSVKLSTVKSYIRRLLKADKEHQ